MKKKSVLPCIGALAIVFTIAGCSTQNTQSSAIPTQCQPKSHLAKKPSLKHDPTSIAIVTAPNATTHHQYRKIGKVSVNHYNDLGIKRQQAIIYDIMKAEASKAGGDAVIVRKSAHADVGDIIVQVPSFD